MRLKQFFVFFPELFGDFYTTDLDSFQIRLPKFSFFIFSEEDPALSGMAN